MKWTPEQERAIYEKDNNILVAAAAGSGKTAVLVERIIEKILDENEPTNIDELLVATFTNAAAEEMRQRIGVALEKALQDNPSSYHLKKQLSLLQRASISTIHSFCMNVVRQYSYVLDLDPSFRIGDEMEIDLLKHEVIDELFEERYGEADEDLSMFFAVIDMFSNDRSDIAVEELVLRLHTFAKQNPWPEKWLQEVAAAYDLSADKGEDKLVWLNILKTEIKEQFNSLKEMNKQAVEIAEAADGPIHYKETLIEDKKIIDKVLDHCNQWDALQEIIKTSTLKALSRQRIECDEAKKDDIKAIRAVFRKQLNTLKDSWFSRSLENHLKDMEVLYPVVKELIQLVLQFEEAFLAEKRKRRIIDFNDLEHFTLQILTEESSDGSKVVPSPIARYYENQFKEILVDEYQDINLVQETIIQSISKQEGPGNVFMVGDVKQSIYRFRHAEPTLFIEKYEKYEKDKKAGTRIDLAKNFRSRETILSGANFIFKQIFDQSLGDIDYDEAAELIYGNLGYDDYPMADDKIELILINNEGEAKEDSSSESDATLEELTKIQLEARLYAQKIKSWFGHGEEELLQVFDKDEEVMRDIQYRDIVILLRSMSGASTIVDEFKKQGIPVYSELRSGYFQAIEIQVMINMLKVIDNPYQDIPLVSVLRSPIVSLNEDQLAQIRLAQKRSSFYEALLEISKGNKEISYIARQFVQDVQNYRELAREGSLSDLIWTIYQKTGYYDFVGGIPGGRQRQSNLRALYDRARSYEETNFRGLFRFLRFIERMEEQNKDLGEARALSEQEDVVRIMTIHKSKGLEFPVVILGEVNKQFNFRDLQENYISNKEYGFATKYIDPIKRISYSTLYYLAVNEEEKRNLLSEEMRVLYVALTRAKEKLVMVGHLNSYEDAVKQWQQVEEHGDMVLPNQLRKSAKSYLDWIGPALIRHQANDLLRENKLMLSTVPESLKNDRSTWQIDVIDKAELIEQQEVEAITREDVQATVQQWTRLEKAKASEDARVIERLQFKYPYEQAAHSRAKQSVTEIKRRFETADEYSGRRIIPSFGKISSERPAFLKQKKELTRAEIGTAMHTVMQHIPLDKRWDKESISNFLTELVATEKLTAEEVDYIDTEAIEYFFQTEIGQLLKESKVERELPFSYTIPAASLYDDWDEQLDEKVLIQGVIDCIIYTDDGIVLLDYKTDQINDNLVDEAVIEQLKNRYKVQMKLYKTALENILKTDIQASYLYFFSKKLTLEM